MYCTHTPDLCLVTVSAANLSLSHSTELRDASEFYEWREAQEKLDDIKRAAHVKQLKDEMVQSAEAAKQAMARQLAENSAVATQMKIEVQWRSDDSAISANTINYCNNHSSFNPK